MKEQFKQNNETGQEGKNDDLDKIDSNGQAIKPIGDKGQSNLLEGIDDRLEISTRNDQNSTQYDEEMLRLVRGTLGSGDIMRHPKDISSEDTMSQLEFQQWTDGILNDDYVNENSITKVQHLDTEHGRNNSNVLTELNHQSQYIKSSESDHGPKSNIQSADSKTKIEHPDSTILGPLDATTLIHDALLSSKTLESLTSLELYTKKPSSDGIGDVDKTISQIADIDDNAAEKEVQHLAVQAVQQAVAEAEAERQRDKNIILKSEVESRAARGKRHHISDDRKKVPKERDLKRIRSAKAFEVNRKPPKKSFLRSLARLYNNEEAGLIMGAILKAKEQVPTGIQGQYFSESEVAALDIFIKEYCRIVGITMNQMKQRIWSNGKKKDCFWRCLQEVLPERSRASLYKHVRRSYHIFKVRGKWTKQEDEQLAKLGQQFSGRWQLVGKEMGRMPEDCRDRWRNYIKCGDNRKTDKWTIDEEERLKEVIAGMAKTENSKSTPKINFTRVSELMGGTRSRIQCRYKWKKLQKRYGKLEGGAMEGVKVWLLSRLKEIWLEEKTEQIDWDALASIFSRSAWKGKDLRSCFENMKKSIECQGRTFPEIIDQLVEKYGSV